MDNNKKVEANEDTKVANEGELNQEEAESPKAEDKVETDASDSKLEEEVANLKKQLLQKDEELKGHIELAQRVKAEFDNYRKRTAREKEQLYSDITGDIITRLLPVIDNLERAISTSSEGSDSKAIISGMEMILKQFKDILAKEGIEEIEASGKEFDPQYHNAVMHIEDEAYGSNTIAEVFQKGYRLKDKVIRHSMVKVAN
jgi:Molecular chaperone GrpE (heat shock protein)